MKGAQTLQGGRGNIAAETGDQVPQLPVLPRFNEAAAISPRKHRERKESRRLVRRLQGGRGNIAAETPVAKAVTAPDLSLQGGRGNIAAETAVYGEYGQVIDQLQGGRGNIAAETNSGGIRNVW